MSDLGFYIAPGVHQHDQAGMKEARSLVTQHHTRTLTQTTTSVACGPEIHRHCNVASMPNTSLTLCNVQEHITYRSCLTADAGQCRPQQRFMPRLWLARFVRLFQHFVLHFGLG